MTKKNILAVVILLILAVSIPLGMYLVKNQTQLQSQADLGAKIDGDANSNGCVGVEDYQEWLKQKNQTGTGLTADFNNDQVVNTDDYNRWLAAFKGANKCQN